MYNIETKTFNKYGTFSGVFLPSTLTILGVMLYLRTGWMVGNVGLSKAILIIVLAKLVTLTTGLSTSSLATNVKMGAGGFYNLLSRSLGAEMGSAIGIPLFLSQALSCALYVAGFTEGWLLLFPQHNPLIISSTIFVIILLLSLIDSKAAIRTQYLMISVIVLSLISFFWGNGELNVNLQIQSTTSEIPFWTVFAIFFPAVTGITAGASMSGNLVNPRKSIPVGTLSAISITAVIYISVAIWLSNNASSNELQNNYSIMVDLSRWPIIVIIGLLSATASSALGSILGAPRTLAALASDKLVPFHRILSNYSKNGEPRYAIIFTALIVEASILLGDLNTIAPLLTMFFLITYGSINAVVAIEKGIGIPSFRPSINIPLIIPIVGSLWCLVTMFLINPVFSGVSISLIILTYFFQLKRHIKAGWGDIRSGVFRAIAEWGAKTSTRMPYHAKTWKPNLLIPVEDPDNWSYIIKFIRNLVFPSGSIRLFSVRKDDSIRKRGFSKILSKFLTIDKNTNTEEINTDKIQESLDELIVPIIEEKIFAIANVIHADNFLEGISITTQALRGSYFPPNTIFFTMSNDPSKDEDLMAMIGISIREKLGIIILSHHAKAAFGNEQTINLWLRRGTPNLDLSVLIAIQLKRNWSNTKIRIISIATDERDQAITKKYLDAIIDHARIPGKIDIDIPVGEFNEILSQVPHADINIFGISTELSCKSMHDIVSDINAACLFIKDGGSESAVA
ncbi:amino acid permease [Candidatus Neomarinimicrobiota bacterium]